MIDTGRMRRGGEGLEPIKQTIDDYNNESLLEAYEMHTIKVAKKENFRRRGFVSKADFAIQEQFRTELLKRMGG